jgi:DNA-binding IclR family transcriptional regulator
VRPEGATFSQWLAASDKPKPTFNRSRERLVEAGRVKREGERYYCVVARDDPEIDNEDEEGMPADQGER